MTDQQRHEIFHLAKFPKADCRHCAFNFKLQEIYKAQGIPLEVN